MQITVLVSILIGLLVVNFIFIKLSVTNKLLRYVPISILVIADIVFLLKYVFFSTNSTVILDILTMILITGGIFVSGVILVLEKFRN